MYVWECAQNIMFQVGCTNMPAPAISSKEPRLKGAYESRDSGLAIVNRHVGILAETKGARIDGALHLAVTVNDEFLVGHPIREQPPSPIFVTLFGPRG